MMCVEYEKRRDSTAHYRKVSREMLFLLDLNQGPSD